MIKETVIVGIVLGAGLAWGHSQGAQETYIAPPLAPITPTVVQAPVQIPAYTPPTEAPLLLPTNEAPMTTPNIPPKFCDTLPHGCTIRT